ncbi:MAG TPA: hypothetical protein P5329_14165 [Candidatus Competibacteraceae bacterium]|nr:hypothetical protein [Candidatus Competibacteraceae bacterium]
MNGDKFLLDTNILIGMHQHSPDVFDRVLASGATTTQSGYSALTRIELLGYPSLTQAEVSVLESLLDKLQRYPLDQLLKMRLSKSVALTASNCPMQSFWGPARFTD